MKRYMKRYHVTAYLSNITDYDVFRDPPTRREYATLKFHIWARTEQSLRKKALKEIDTYPVYRMWHLDHLAAYLDEEN